MLNTLCRETNTSGRRQCYSLTASCGNCKLNKALGSRRFSVAGADIFKAWSVLKKNPEAGIEAAYPQIDIDDAVDTPHPVTANSRIEGGKKVLFSSRLGNRKWRCYEEIKEKLMSKVTKRKKSVKKKSRRNTKRSSCGSENWIVNRSLSESEFGNPCKRA
ncbi:Uncharacterized protein TCM_020296 [Theobroma cacao]|uniref:Uncharacterized protein n=1 Tax=Theobroma cacao TaxID=3641 RepID=A0A061ELL3_THECC|nr:Uncharacterized protein TCM_020296 [Theobroma cacao]